jgi:predicted AlkP superfamily pyrophosphatase or phosphodiesterase
LLAFGLALAEPILRGEIEAGNMPTLARWLASGSHRLIRWECDVPSMTTSGQSGILYGTLPQQLGKTAGVGQAIPDVVGHDGEVHA